MVRYPEYTSRNKIKVIFTAWIIVQMLPLVTPNSSNALTVSNYKYRENTGAHEDIFQWQMEKDERVRIAAKHDEEIYTSLCKISGETLEWQFKKPEIDIKVHRQGNFLFVNGRKAGKPMKEKIEIDDSPWYQPLSYSLRRLLDGEDTSIKFWMLRPDNLKIIKMKAIKKEIESMHINGKRLDARKVEVSPNGILSALWSCHYWFRVEDHLFLRYEGIHGPPGTQKTVIHLYE